jgi:P4 family phage/plasmid primase-like protien
MIDFFSAQKFLHALIRDDAQPVFQTFDDNRERTKSGNARKELARKFAGTLKQHLFALNNFAREGAGIYVQVNAGQRGKHNVTGVRAVFIDNDDPNNKLDFEALPPSIIVESSPGKTQVYWLLDGNCQVRDFGKAQKQLAAHFNTDKSIHNADRVMRLPGTLHQKDPTKPFRVRLIECHPERVYSIGEVIDAYPAPIGYVEIPDAAKEPDATANELTEEAKASLRRVQAWLDRMRVGYTIKASQPNKIIFDKCVFNADHRGEHGMAIKIAPGGGIWCGCWHSSCGGNAQRWSEVRALIGGWSARWMGFDRGDHSEMARRALLDLRADTTEECVFNDKLYRYNVDRFTWDPIPDEQIDRQIISYAGLPKGQTGRITLKWPDIVGTRKTLARLAARHGFFESAPRGIMFTNGFLHANKELHLEPPSSGQRQREAMSFPWDPHAPAERWAQFLREVFAPDADVEEKILLLQEFVGAALIGIAPRMQKALLLLGDGQNGKSVFLKCIGQLFPQRFVTAVRPQDWGNEYYRAMLAGARLNLVSELPETDILDAEAFKAIIDGSEINGRFIRQEVFKFAPEAAHLFSANNLPGTTDFSHGFWRRLLVVKFNRLFTDHEANPYLADEIIENERPGICAWALRGAERVLRNGCYTIPESTKAILEEWRRSSDVVAAFLSECTEPLPLAALRGVPARDLYATFRAWLTENGHRAMSNKKFGERMRRLHVAPQKMHGVYYYSLRLNYEPRIF